MICSLIGSDVFYLHSGGNAGDKEESIAGRKKREEEKAAEPDSHYLGPFLAQQYDNA